MTRDEIEAAFASADPEMRRRATQELPRLSGGGPLELLVRALGDEDWRVRKEAGQVALALPERDVASALVKTLGPGDNVGLRNGAVETLASLGPVAVPLVVEALPGLDADGRKLATEVLGRARDPVAMHTLERLLSDEDLNVRVAAAEAIGELGPLALDAAAGALTASLASSDLHLKLASLDGLNRLGVVVPWERIGELTKHPILRRAALVAASRTGRAEAGEALALALSDDQRAVFSAALVGLAELVLGSDLSTTALRERVGPLKPATRDRLLAAAQPGEGDGDSSLRRAALVVAAALGEQGAIDFAIDALVDDRAATEGSAARRIFGSQALPRILARAAHGDAPLRAAAIDLVTSLADSPHRQAIRLALRTAIADPAPLAASAALLALGSLGGPEDIAPVFAVVCAGADGTAAAAEEALAALSVRHADEARSLVKDAASDERSTRAAAIVIGALAGGALSVPADDVAFLGSALSSADPRTRRAAVTALADVGSHLGLQAVEFALADEERDIRLAAVGALGRLRRPDGQPAGVERLLALLRRSEDVELMAAAVRALGDTGDRDAARALMPILVSGSPVVAVAAIETLGRHADAASLDALMRASSHAHAEVVKAALLALEGFPDERVCSSMGAALGHDAWDVRRLAADCLGRFGSEDALELLRARLSRETEPLVLEAIDRAIGDIESPATMRRAGTIASPKADP